MEDALEKLKDDVEEAVDKVVRKKKGKKDDESEPENEPSNEESTVSEDRSAYNCSMCSGLGLVNNDLCKQCNGTGKV